MPRPTGTEQRAIVGYDQMLSMRKGMLEMTFSDQEIIKRFPVGYYPLHPNVSLNFQMNRFWGWATPAWPSR